MDSYILQLTLYIDKYTITFYINIILQSTFNMDIYTLLYGQLYFTDDI